MFHTLIQLIKFGAVGLAATAVHISVWTVAIEMFQIDPFWANFPAFCLAFIISFFGHLKWTFKEQHERNSSENNKPLSKFLCVSLIGFTLNTSITYLIVDILNKPYMYAGFLMATAVPIALFLLNKFWVFSPNNNNTSIPWLYSPSLLWGLVIANVITLAVQLYHLDIEQLAKLIL